MEKEKLTEAEMELKASINKALDEKFPDRSKMITVTRIEPIVSPPASTHDTVTVLKRKPSKTMKVLRWIDQEMMKITIFTILGIIIMLGIVLLL